MTPPRVAMWLSCLTMGGAERQSLQVLDGLADAGFGVELWVWNELRDQECLEVRPGVSVTFLDTYGRQRAEKLRFLEALLQRTGCPDLLFTVNFDMNLVAAWLRVKRRITCPIISVLHSTVLPLRDQPRIFLYRVSMLLTERLVFVSQNQFHYWCRRGLGCFNGVTIRNGVDLDAFGADPMLRQSTRRRLGVPDDSVVISVVAAFRKEKNHGQILRVFGQLVKSHPATRLLLVGDGPMRPAIEDGIRAQGLNGKVILTGRQHDVRPFLLASDIGVICSVHHETFSLAALETLACGIPMIMSDLAGASEIVRHGENGLLFRRGDDAGLLQSIKFLLDRERRDVFSQNALRSASSFSLAEMKAQYVALARRVLDLPTGGLSQ